MASQQYRLEKLAKAAAEHRAGTRGKAPTVRVAGSPFTFLSVIWGGVSPMVCLKSPEGASICHSAAAWKKLGADL